MFGFDVIWVVGALVLICVIVCVPTYVLGWKEQWKNAGVLQAIATMCAATVLATGAVMTAEKLGISFGARKVSKLRAEYKYLFGNHFDRRWKIHAGAPTVFKGLTSSEQGALEALEVTNCVPRIADVPLESGGDHYARTVESKDQYTGVGEATGCFYLANLFERLGLQLVLDWDLPKGLPNDPCIVLGSKNVTYLSPKVLDLRWYAEDGYVKRLGEGIVQERSVVYDECLGVQRDYGILSKVHNRASGNDIIICEGVHSYGTYAVARELVANTGWLREVLEQRLAGSVVTEDHLFQILFEVTVDEGVITDVKVVDVEIWPK